MNPDLTQTYIPDVLELKTADIQSLRAFLAAGVTTNDVDTSPNTPFGDLQISPGAVSLAMQQECWRRFFSDMDLQNTSEGVTYNCEFLRAYLEQHGVYDTTVLRKSFGLMRLSFSSPAALTLDASTTFTSGSSEFRPALPYEGALEIIAPGDVAPASGNFARLTAFGAELWVVDVLITSETGAFLETDSTFDVDRVIDGLSEAILLEGFQTGTPPSNLVALAQRARFNTHSLTPNTRGGIMSGINQQLPDIKSISCVVSGDPEMTRDSVNPAVVSSGCIDVLVRGETLAAGTCSVRVNLIETADGPRFFGELLLPQRPVVIDSIAYDTLTIVGPDVISVSADPSKYPALSAAYGDQERLFVEFEMPMDGSTPLVATEVDNSGATAVEFARFTVAYRFDPVVPVVASLLKGDNAPIGLRLYVRYFTPAVIHTLNVVYNRRAGSTLSLAQPRSEILTALNHHTLYTPAGAPDVVDSMRYAGAHSVERVEVDSTIRFSCADFVFIGTTTPTEILLEADHTAFKNNVRPIAHGSVIDMLSPDFTCQAGVGLFGVSGARTATWLLTTDNLIFSENRTLG